jgi:hypothetical protein
VSEALQPLGFANSASCWGRCGHNWHAWRWSHANHLLHCQAIMNDHEHWCATQQQHFAAVCKREHPAYSTQ